MSNFTSSADSANAEPRRITSSMFEERVRGFPFQEERGEVKQTRVSFKGSIPVVLWSRGGSEVDARQVFLGDYPIGTVFARDEGGFVAMLSSFSPEYAGAIYVNETGEEAMFIPLNYRGDPITVGDEFSFDSLEPAVEALVTFVLGGGPVVGAPDAPAPEAEKGG